MGEDFYVLGRVEVGAKIKVGEIDGAEESIVGDDRVEEDVDGGERSDLSGGRTGRGKVTTRSATNTTVYTRRSSAGGRGGGEKRGTTSPSPRDCSTWRGRRRDVRDRGSGKSRRA